jgi:hypothetical protein
MSLEIDKSEAGQATRVGIALNPAGVAEPALRAMRDSVEVVGTALRAVQDSSRALHGMPGAQVGLAFTTPGEDEGQRRLRHANWLLNRGFQDISKGLKESLEEAYFYCAIVETASEQRSPQQLVAWISDLKKRSNRLNFPDLLARVKASLGTPLLFDEELLSVQAVRNCLEHRSGIVGVEDLRGKPEFRLLLPQLRMVVRADGKERDLVVGMIVEEGAEIVAIRSAVERTYKLGETITFSATEFSDIALACCYFANDLCTKLPSIEIVNGSKAG